MDTPLHFQKLRSYYLSLMPGLSPAGWQICQSVLHIRRVKKGELLLRQGAVCHNVSFLNHGLMRMYSTGDNGREHVVEFFREGEYTSDYRSFLLREPSLTSIQALEDTELIETSYDDLQMIYRQVPEANAIGRLVAEQMFIEVCLRSSGKGASDIDQQYRNLMLHKPWLMQRVPQYMIASYLGVTPEAFSRIKARATKKAKNIPLTPTILEPGVAR